VGQSIKIFYSFIIHDLYLSISQIVHRKNYFAEISKNLAINLKTILLDHQNNYVRNSNMMSKKFCKKFYIYILAASLNILYNYFSSSIKLFSTSN